MTAALVRIFYFIFLLGAGDLLSVNVFTTWHVINLYRSCSHCFLSQAEQIIRKLPDDFPGEINDMNVYMTDWFKFPGT